MARQIVAVISATHAINEAHRKHVSSRPRNFAPSPSSQRHLPIGEIMSPHALVAIGFIILSLGCQSAAVTSDEAATIEAIRKLGGQVQFDESVQPRRVTKVYLHKTAVSDNDLNQLAKLTKLKNLFLGHTGITDAGLEELKSIRTLETLSLNSTRVTDAGLKSLAELKQLKTLNVQETAVTKKAVNQLKSILPNLAIGK